MLPLQKLAHNNQIVYVRLCEHTLHDQVMASDQIACSSVTMIYVIEKSKALPLQPWTGPVGSRRLRIPDFKTIGK